MATYTRTPGNEGQTSEQKRPPLKWIVNFPNEKLSKLERPCFVAACHGNEKMATLLNYFIYEASREAEKLKVNLESCSDITLELSQDEILEKLKYASKKTLIGHLDKFNEWGYVGSRKYGRTYTVHFKAVQHAIDNPPAMTDKKGKTSQSCSTTTSQKRQHSKVVDDEMLYQLQQNVVELQLKVVELQQKVVNLQLSQSREVASPLAPYTIYDAYRLLDCNRLIETIDNNESSEKYTIVSSDTAHASHSQDEQLFTNDEPQGDTHATLPAPGHPHRVGDAAVPGGASGDNSVDDGQVVAPEVRPVLEAGQEIAQTPTTTTPAQSRSLPQAEQAASGAPKPLAEPEMSGKWSHERCVEYAEWCNQKRYTEKMREEQLKAAHAIHKNDVALTLEQFKQAYDERNDAWWQEHKKKLHVTDMKARGSSGIDRVHEMLQRIEDAASKSRAQPRLQLVSSAPPANAFIARSLDKEYNQRKLAEMRAQVALKQAQQIGV